MLAAINPKQLGDENAVDEHALVAGVLNSQMGAVGVTNDGASQGDILEKCLG